MLEGLAGAQAAVDFIIWVRADTLNEGIEGTYLLPVADFPDHLYIWPSTLTLAKYEQYAHSSIAAIFGLPVGGRAKGNSTLNREVTIQ